MPVCKSCGSVVQPGNSFCPVCGQGLFAAEEALICAECHTPNAPGTRFCKTCGAVLLRKPKTVQCLVCGSENAPDALYCTVCGSEMPGEFEPELEVESINKLQNILPLIESYSKAVENKYVALSADELRETTYVCPVCGKRNDISDIKCARCGRDKNRSEQLIQKQRIPTFEEAVEIPDKKHIAPSVKTERVVSDKRPKFINGKKAADSSFAGTTGGYAGGGFAGGYAGGFTQNSPIVQPLAIVPYVTQNQPLWQKANAEDYEAYKKTTGLDPKKNK